MEQSQILSFLIEMAGFVGVALYLGSYALLQAGVIRGNGYPYTLANLFAAIFVLIGLAGSFNLWAAIIQISWIAISIGGMVRYYFLSRGLRFSEEEQAFLDSKLPKLPRLAGRKLLDAGKWRNVAKDQDITREGKVLAKLIYLAKGKGEVTLGGNRVGTVNARALIGEMTVLHGGAASATVTLTQPSRIFEITSQALKKLSDSDSEFKMLIEHCLGVDTRKKLLAANERMRNAG